MNLIFTLAEAEKIRSQVLTLASGVASLHNDYIDFQPPVDESSPDGIPIPAIKAEMPAGAVPGTQYVRTDLPDWSQAANRTFQPKAEIRTRTADFFLYGLTKSKFLGGLIVLFSMMTFASEILGDQITETIARLMDTTWQQLSQWYFAVTLLAAIGLLLLLYFLASLASIIFAIVRFYHFRVSREADNIHIEYGLLT